MEFNSPFPLTLGMSFAAKLVVSLKLPSLSWFLAKATHSLQPQAFPGRMTAWSARNDCFCAFTVVRSTFPGKNLNVRFQVRTLRGESGSNRDLRPS